MEEIYKNTIHEVEIHGVNSDGFGVCRINGRAVFVKNALQGEKWKIKILKSNKTAIWAKTERLLSPASKERRMPECPHFGICGGCNFLHLDYESELAAKVAGINNSLSKIAKTEVRVEKIVGAQNTVGYRNKAILAVGKKDGIAVAGFYRAGSNDIVAVSSCLLLNKNFKPLFDAVLSWINKFNVPVFDPVLSPKGVRHIYMRSSENDRVMVCLVSSTGFGKNTGALINALKSSSPLLSGIVLNLNGSGGNVVLGSRFYTLWGEDFLNNSLSGFSYKVSLRSFYQVNSKQAERLYELVMDMVGKEKLDVVLDLYCGIGTISSSLSKIAKKVIAAEIVPEAIENAKENAKLNKIENVEFMCADAGDAAKTLSERGIFPDCVVVDPPRKGMDEAAVVAVSKMKPNRIVYVSCNPSTLSRDIFRFEELGYQAVKIVAVDMFPRTKHVETIVLMSRVKE